jgi:hypothetical protein
MSSRVPFEPIRCSRCPRIRRLQRLSRSGFVLTGNSVKRLLIRAIGPGLNKLGVTEPLDDPELIVRRGSDILATNDNWTVGDLVLTDSFKQVGAFALEPGSKDAAVVLDLAPGVYTATVRGVGSATGSALIEIYELP